MDNQPPVQEESRTPVAQPLETPQASATANGPSGDNASDRQCTGSLPQVNLLTPVDNPEDIARNASLAERLRGRLDKYRSHLNKPQAGPPNTI
ncbi:hypothetical protein BWQ96_01754 [Gracilariopsis chorda]|uniref:Uncharacterized protein n=1 Tax=Gracilariopsis chorda TaxID=448386 RepID=A0A2V3J2I2_9FLOR|nr:hypothetical protein BWQ96_01754 [Gracilariopsis chorda]|eukprot:PXF48585.1 hypothetical protein BWQ96_01754 [Gracilariopsis chorda]